MNLKNLDLAMIRSKVVFQLCLVAFLLTSCNEVEFNNPAFQADINYKVWRADTFQASFNADGDLVITGTNNFETVILTLQSDEVGSTGLGPDWNSKGEFIDGLGKRYTTNIEPDETVSVYRDLGRVEITSKNETTNTYTGNFYFEAFDENGQNPVGVSNGIFFEVKLN